MTQRLLEEHLSPDGFFLSDPAKYDMENLLPEYRAVLGLQHSWTNDLTLSLRGNLYGGYKNMKRFNPDEIQEYDPLMQIDINLKWEFSDGRYNVVVGGDNIFDEQPDSTTFEICCVGKIAFSTIMDWQGPFYYVRGSLRWD